MTQPNLFDSGFRVPNADDLEAAIGYPKWAFQTGITAKAGGGQSTATQLTETISVVTTVASGADSVKLPKSNPGLIMVVVNASATSMQVFGTSPDTINAVATGTGVAQAGGIAALYVCAANGLWRRLLSA